MGLHRTNRKRRRWREPCRAKQRRGQALIEFGMVALVLYVLIGAVITFGIWFHASSQIQQAAQVGARELSQIPLPGNMTFEEALEFPEVRSRVYDDRWLVINLDRFEEEFPDQSFFEVAVPMMPIINQQLALTYILDESEDGQRWLRYPGAVLERRTLVSDEINSNAPVPDFVRSDLIVQVPLVVRRDADGIENIRWLNVVEEIDEEPVDDTDTDANTDPFQLFSLEPDGSGQMVVGSPPGSSDSLHGVVALRINFPAQSPWLSSFESSRGEFPPPINADSPNPVLTNLNGVEVVSEINPEDRLGELLSRPVIRNQNGEDVFAGTYGGNYGLGIQGAFASSEFFNEGPDARVAGVRPYRRVLVSHAIFRREMYETP